MEKNPKHRKRQKKEKKEGKAGEYLLTAIFSQCSKNVLLDTQITKTKLKATQKRP